MALGQVLLGLVVSEDLLSVCGRVQCRLTRSGTLFLLSARASSSRLLCLASSGLSPLRPSPRLSCILVPCLVLSPLGLSYLWCCQPPLIRMVPLLLTVCFEALWGTACVLQSGIRQSGAVAYCFLLRGPVLGSISLSGHRLPDLLLPFVRLSLGPPVPATSHSFLEREAQNEPAQHEPQEASGRPK